MAENKELIKIKKIYGEKFMHLCRALFPTLLEAEGKLLEILQQTFSNNSPTLYEDIVNNDLAEEFKNYIYSKIDMEDEEKNILEEKTPYELLSEAGYELYECKTEEEIQAFKKYYKSGEELCTFHGGRLNRCVVFFCSKKRCREDKKRRF